MSALSESVNVDALLMHAFIPDNTGGINAPFGPDLLDRLRLPLHLH